ncbi:hypothetical protein Btru_005917 [Bulinus truncatus]|nr:hypothetical protein Btru_005917 [Bulinus truncatus]
MGDEKVKLNEEESIVFVVRENNVKTLGGKQIHLTTDNKTKQLNVMREKKNHDDDDDGWGSLRAGRVIHQLLCGDGREKCLYVWRLRNIFCNMLTSGGRTKTKNEQAGFRPGQVQSHANGSLLYSIFVDFEKTPDSVDRDVVWNLMAHYGIPPNFIAIIQQIEAGLLVVADHLPSGSGLDHEEVY